MIWHDSGAREAREYSATDLKICDLCGALNLAANVECFVCRWRGHFDRRPEVVKLAMEILERRHGRLDASLVTEWVAPTGPDGPERMAGPAHWFARLLRWLARG